MTETALTEFYAAVGGSYDEVLQRLPSEAIILKFLRKFPTDPSYDALKKAQAETDLHGAFLAAHTLKGVAGSLGLKNLADTTSALTEVLRPQTVFPEQALFTAVDTAYACVMEELKRLD